MTSVAELGGVAVSKVKWTGTVTSEVEAGSGATNDILQGVEATSVGWPGWSTDPVTRSGSSSGDPPGSVTVTRAGTGSGAETGPRTGTRGRLRHRLDFVFGRNSGYSLTQAWFLGYSWT